MNNKNVPDRIISHLIVGVVVFGFAVLIRLFILQSGLDTGTANLVFIGFFAFGMVFYWAFASICIAFFTPLFSRIFWRLKKTEEAVFSPETAPAIPITKDRDMPTVMLVQQFCDYSRIILDNCLPEEDLSLINVYIRFYADGQPLKNVKQVRVTNLTNADLYHYGWNLWYHFGKKDKQEDVVIWLKSVFVNLKEIENATIKGKLTIEDRNHYAIELCKDIAGEYLHHD